MTATRGGHIPVLLPEVLQHLCPRDGGFYLDGTFGAGGYTAAILGAARCRVLALDRDPSAIASGAGLAAAHPGRLTLEHRRFGALLDDAAAAGSFDGVVLDLGVSSMQIDRPERGFSFQADGPLDMRMDAAAGPSAADVVNSAPEELLADILHGLGEERRARAIARAIVRRREERPIERTADLAAIATRVLGPPRAHEKHPATRVFQALRLYVNDELGELARGLAAAERLLRPGGRLVAVTFHSLEDRIVKRFLTERSGRAAGGSRHLPRIGTERAPSFRIVNSKPVIPSGTEIAANPRARSAKLRAGERTEAAPWELDRVALGVPAVARNS